MGQQQLLLIILVTIIVGIATVVAINTFSSAADSANLDAVRQDLASIAASSQGYFMKPTALGGGGNTFDGLTFKNIAFGGTIDGDFLAHNQNGTYQINGGSAISGSATTFTVTAYPSSASGYSAGTASGPHIIYTIQKDDASITTPYTGS